MAGDDGRNLPTYDDELPVPVDEPNARRPWTVQLGLLLSYLEGIAFLALGARDPGSSNGLSGLTFIVLGVLVLALTTLTGAGGRLARLCLLVPLLAAAVGIVGDGSLASWQRGLPVVSAAVIVTALLLLPPSRRFFGDDETTLGTP